MAAVLLTGRCNPYGAETGGPKRVLGGLHGPNSATAPDLELPDNVRQGEWACENPAQVRCRMVCEHGHKGQVMQLCSWHDEITYSGERAGGTFRQVQSTIRVRGHYEEIQRRQSGFCPPCGFPGEFGQLYHEINQWQGELSLLSQLGRWRSARAQMLRAAIEAAAATFDEGRLRGIIHNCPLKLVPVS